MRIRGRWKKRSGVNGVNIHTRSRRTKGDVLNCCDKMPSLGKARLPGSCNLPEQLEMSPSRRPGREVWLKTEEPLFGDCAMNRLKSVVRGCASGRLRQRRFGVLYKASAARRAQQCRPKHWWSDSGFGIELGYHFGVGGQGCVPDSLQPCPPTPTIPLFGESLWISKIRALISVASI